MKELPLPGAFSLVESELYGYATGVRGVSKYGELLLQVSIVKDDENDDACLHVAQNATIQYLRRLL